MREKDEGDECGKGTSEREGGRGRGEGARLGEEGVREKTKEVGEIEGDHEGLRWKRRENKRRVKYE